MDGLALLCNLFADGPVTLKRLRLAGVSSLGALERAAPARLAEWLHASVPQAQAFGEEARKLVRRLAEENPRHEHLGPATRARFVVPAPAPVIAERAAGAPPGAHFLHAGLFAGLDEALCERLALQHVRTVQALSELAGLALARRTGIPYSTMLELSRQARRFSAERARELRPVSAPFAPRLLARASEPRPVSLNAVELRAVELRPFDARAKPAPAEAELARSDEFTLPAVEPESAGPFG